MAKIKSLLSGFYADRPGFFLACTRFFFMFLFWIAFYLAAFTARGINGPNIFNVTDLGGVGRTFVFIWWILMLLFVAFSLLKNAKTVKIVAIVQLAFIVIYLGIVMLNFGSGQELIEGYTGITIGYSFGFWLMLILLGLLVISVFFTHLIEKVIAKLVPPQVLHPEPAAAVAPAPVDPIAVEPQPVASPPVEPAPAHPEPIVEKPAAPVPPEPPLSDPVHFEPAPVEPIENQPVIVKATPIEPTPAEPAPVEPKPES